MISPSNKAPRNKNYDSKGRTPYYSLLFSDFYLRELINSLMIKNKMTKKSLSRRTGLDYEKLVRYLKGYINPKTRRLQDKEILQVAEHFGLDISIDIKFSNKPIIRIIE
jgi:hypothetical protein